MSKVNEVGLPLTALLIVTVVKGLGVETTVTAVTTVFAAIPTPVTLCPTPIKKLT